MASINDLMNKIKTASAEMGNPEAARDALPAHGRRRKWTAQDYAMRGLTPRGSKVALSFSVDPEIKAHMLDLAASRKCSFGEMISELVLAAVAEGDA